MAIHRAVFHQPKIMAITIDAVLEAVAIGQEILKVGRRQVRAKPIQIKYKLHLIRLVSNLVIYYI